MPDIRDLIEDRYRLLKIIGKGGTATVYEAEDIRLGRHIAVKFITYNRSFETPQVNKKRFEREIKMLSQLQHPNIVSIWDYGEHNGSPYFVMDYFPNGTLKDKLEKLNKPIPWQDAIQILLPIAHGLSYAHEKRIIHRDIKPSNILLSSSGAPMLSDFGIARALEINDGFTTETGALVGSYFYAAPEQIQDPKSADARADIFSLGVVLHEMLTGNRPSTNNFSDPLQVKDSREHVLDLPEELYGILSKALSGNPKNRYQNMDAFILALENLLRTNGVFVNPIHTEIAKAKSEKNMFSMARKVLIGTVIMAALIAVIGLMTPDLMKTLPPVSWFGDPTSIVDVTITSTPTSVISTKTPTQNMNLAEEISHSSGIDMRLIPAGEFTMGSNETRDEEPIHMVFLNAFYIDKYEVTNAQYKLCMNAGVCQSPKDFSSNTRSSYFDNPEFENYPVIYVDWNMARTYCEWREGRLPTEAEWEKAARGTDGRTYPWGETLDCEHANYAQDKSDACVGDTTPVGSYESGQSFYGLYDMAGNVSEWVADWYQYDYYETLGNSFLNPQGPASGEARVFRGGSWNYLTGDVRSANRNGYSAAVAIDSIGFRCAQDP